MEQLVTSLGINWKVLIAQTVNFAVLVAVLNYFLYKPILKILDERKKKIADDLENQKKSEERLREIDSEKEGILNKARESGNQLFKNAEKKSTELEEKLHKEANEQKEKIIAEGKKEIGMEKEKIMREIKSEAKSLIKLSLEAGFKDITDTSLNEKIAVAALKNIDSK